MNRWLINGCLILGGLLVSFLLVEGALRLVSYSHPSFFVYDDDLGFCFQPNAEGKWNKEGYSFVRINSRGLHDVEHTLKKQEDVYRIAVLGDSFMAALHVDLEKIFVRRLERNLQTLGFENKEIEVINFGVPGYGTARELIMLRTQVLQYNPDMVLLALLTGNDIKNNVEILDGSDLVPYFHLNDQNALVLDNSFRDANRPFGKPGDWKYRLYHEYLKNLRIVQLGNAARQAMYQKQAHKNVDKNKGFEVGISERVYSPPESEDWQYAWRVTEMLLLELKKELDQAGIRFVVATLSNGIQVHPKRQAKTDYMEKLGLDTLFYPDERIRRFLHEHGIESVILAPKLALIAERENLFLHGFKNATIGKGHWNEEGHKFAADIVAQSLIMVQ